VRMWEERGTEAGRGGVVDVAGVPTSEFLGLLYGRIRSTDF